ncbi:MAG: DbpA RNA binding domain-containing protein [Treponema sp.]|jgi:hypothetical protein|nr:DbpA RNA binding domain-containing protein [Treponema sp.]
MNEESIRKRLQVLLDKIQNEADPVLLNRCRSIFRQEVPFFRRSYMAAYLLLSAEDSGPGKTAGLSSGAHHQYDRERKKIREKNRENRNNYESDTEGSNTLSEEESARLFVGIGRNRKVFPREILALVNARAKIAREDIGAIRILDNYSFVQVRDTKADDVIQALNGQSFRGRPLTVNYARSRREEEDGGGDNDLPANGR